MRCSYIANIIVFMCLPSLTQCIILEYDTILTKNNGDCTRAPRYL